MLDAILNQEIQTPPIIGQISMIALGIGLALFVYTTGFQWLRDSVRSWKSESAGNIVDINETVRKLSLLILISSFTLITDVVTNVVTYAKDTLETENSSDKIDKSVMMLEAKIRSYAMYAHYYNMLETVQNAEPDKKTALEIDFKKRYPNGPSTAPLDQGWWDAIVINVQSSLVHEGAAISVGISKLFLTIAKILSGLFKYAFSILFQILMGLVPLGLAFSIPKSMENSYATVIRRALNVGLAFVVMAMLDGYLIQAMVDITTSITSAFSTTSNVNISELDNMLFYALPIFSIVMMGLYSSTLWISSSITGGGDGEGGIATKGFGAAMGVVGGAIAIGLAGKKAGGAAAGAVGGLGKQTSNK